MTKGQPKVGSGKSMALRLGRADPGGVGGRRAELDLKRPVCEVRGLGLAPEFAG